MGTKRNSVAGRQLRLSKARLDELVEEALPFETQILGTTVIVEGMDITDDDQLVAVCRKGKTKQRISLSELPLPSPAPEGAEWIAAYRYWRTGKIR